MGPERKAAPFVRVLRMIPLLIVLPLLVVSVQGREGAVRGQPEGGLTQAGHPPAAPSQAPDATEKYLVRAIEISGNSLLSTQDLLRNIPALYQSQGKDAGVAAQTYDFAVLRDVIRAPGALRQVSESAIKGFTDYLLSRYNDRGYAGIYVYVSASAIMAGDSPAGGVQRLEGDILPIRIIEGRVASIEMRHYDADGDRKDKGVLKDSLVAAWSPVKPGEGIKKKSLDDFVRLLNENPDRYVRHSVSRSDEPNSLDLIYAIYEGNPWHPYIQVDNSGTDERQWSPRIGLINTDLTGRDDRLSLMYQADLDDLSENYAAFGSYGIPLLTPKLRLSAFGGYSEFDITPQATGGLVNFLGAGSFYGANLRYSVVQVRDWFFDLTSSFSWERSKIDSDLGLSSTVNMRLLGLGFEVHRGSAMSDTSLLFDALHNVGGSDLDDFEEARTGADPDLVKYFLSLSHRQYLDKAKLNHMGGSFRTILTSDRLVPAKMTTFGGLYSVRGYPEDALVADGGILASLEYRRCLIRDLGAGKRARSDTNKKTWPVDVSLLAFTDYGQARIEDPQPGELKTQDLWGIGLGTLITVGSKFEARAYYGWALHEIVRPGDDRILADEGDGAWNFSFLLRW
ncbi:MAG: ShlB/FhaC/HecB family hemolysin secretion/activation protein [Sedimentisphaerales bacterium]|nr:ShlB/FhaC/HecB family hemolysin secretion/activation protein [Sedimentisphaerales bacterium]